MDRGARGRRLVVCDRVPIRRRALAEVLEDAGFMTVEAAHFELASDEPDGTVIVWSCDERDLTTTADLAARGDELPVVALLEDPSPRHYREALKRGAAGVASHDASASDLETLISLAVEGRTTLPVDVARDIARDEPVPEPVLTEIEIGWLGSLARGIQVSCLAADTGLSEREMYRALNRVYEKLGVATRVEAVVVATQLGLLS